MMCNWEHNKSQFSWEHSACPCSAGAVAGLPVRGIAACMQALLYSVALSSTIRAAQRRRRSPTQLDSGVHVESFLCLPSLLRPWLNAEKNSRVVESTLLLDSTRSLLVRSDPNSSLLLDFALRPPDRGDGATVRVCIKNRGLNVCTYLHTSKLPIRHCLLASIKLIHIKWGDTMYINHDDICIYLCMYELPGLVCTYYGNWI